jgi:monoamine oxidase
VAVDAAVITLPLGVLQAGDVTFDPALSPARQAAIAALGMGLYNKIFLRFDTPPHLPAADWLEHPNGDDLLFCEWVNLAHVLGAPALLGFNAAATAREVERWDDATTTAAATDALRAMLGSATPAPVAVQITRWGADAHARGSYSYHALGAGERARAALFGPDWEGRIAFAGEACSQNHPSTVHGAWTSGLEAAQTLRI